jgi:hypothetical protein
LERTRREGVSRGISTQFYEEEKAAAISFPKSLFRPLRVCLEMAIPLQLGDSCRGGDYREDAHLNRATLNLKY